MKKLLVLLLTLAMAVAMLACPALAEEEKPLEGGFIPVLPLGVAHQFWQAVKTGAEQAAEEYGVTIVFDGPQDETMVDRQVDILRANLTNEDLIAVCMAAIDTQAVEADLSSVKEQGMPEVGRLMNRHTGSSLSRVSRYSTATAPAASPRARMTWPTKVSQTMSSSLAGSCA